MHQDRTIARVSNLLQRRYAPSCSQTTRTLTYGGVTRTMTQTTVTSSTHKPSTSWDAAGTRLATSASYSVETWQRRTSLQPHDRRTCPDWTTSTGSDCSEMLLRCLSQARTITRIMY